MHNLSPKDPRAICRFRLLARVATGGMATLYLGLTVGGRPVAVKRAHQHLSRDPGVRARFRREVAGLRLLGGNGTPALLDADVQASRQWLATEFLPSVPLAEAVGGYGPFADAAAWKLAAELVEALHRIHQTGIVHLDVNPSNVLLTADGPRLIDLGIAESLSGDGLTAAGAPGTPGFAAPEQETGSRIGPAADVYSLAATLAYALTGTAPGPDPAWWQALLGHRLGPVLVPCLDFDAAARPTVAELTARVDAARDPAVSPWSAALPQPVLDEIDRRVRELADPPSLGAGRGPRSRRGLLAGVVLTGLGIVALATGDDRRPPPGTVRAGAGTVKRAREPEAAPRQLQFRFTGNTSLSMVKYTVNGEATTEKDLELPWERSVAIPPLPTETDFRFECRFPPGQINYKTLVDGYLINHGTAGAQGQDGSTEFEGTV